MKSISQKEILLPYLLLIPCLSHLILPSGMESRMYVNIAGIPLYIPNICYLLYLSWYPNKFKINIRAGVRKVALIFSCVTFFYAFLQLLILKGLSDIDTTICLIIDNFSLVYFTIIFLCFPLSWKQINNAKWLIIFTNVYISLQVILFSTGIMSYQTETGNDLVLSDFDYAGIFRISTSVGAATGTAIVLCMLGIIINSYLDISKKLKMILLGLFTISIFFTISRGGILTWVVYLCMIGYYNLFRKSNFKQKLLFISIVTISLYLFNYMGVFEPIKQRNIDMSSQDISAGRDYVQKRAFELFTSTSGVGIGSGQLYPDKSLNAIIKSPYRMAPHNTYLLILVELGIFGAILFSFFILYVVFHLDYRTAISKMLIVIMIINLNTEGVFLNAEFYAIIALFIVCSLNTSKMSRKELFYE